MPTREDGVRNFWMRLTEGRGALGGAVLFHPPAEDLLDDWKPQVLQELSGFLRDFEPNFAEFAGRAMALRVKKLSDKEMLGLISYQASAAFCRWLKDRGVPADMASQAASIYQFDFAIRDPGM